MYVGFYVVRNERIFDSVVCCDLEGIADAHVIGGKSHNTAEKSTVRTMTVIGFGKRSIKGKFYFFKRRAILAAPAVWELDGPIIFGPMTSKTLIKDIVNLLL